MSGPVTITLANLYFCDFCPTKATANCQSFCVVQSLHSHSKQTCHCDGNYRVQAKYYFHTIIILIRFLLNCFIKINYNIYTAMILHENQITFFAIKLFLFFLRLGKMRGLAETTFNVNIKIRVRIRIDRHSIIFTSVANFFWAFFNSSHK